MALLVPKIGLMVKGSLGATWPSVQAEMASVLEIGRDRKKRMNKRGRREKKNIDEKIIMEIMDYKIHNDLPESLTKHQRYIIKRCTQESIYQY